VLAWLDSKASYTMNTRYVDSKLCAAMVMYELAARIDRTKVVLNMACPGLVNTNVCIVSSCHVDAELDLVRFCS
jgi:NAD(P)-dependent dehydrogenase (short-subunit alcohol dehydrogenase family)